MGYEAAGERGDDAWEERGDDDEGEGRRCGAGGLISVWPTFGMIIVTHAGTGTGRTPTCVM